MKILFIVFSVVLFFQEISLKAKGKYEERGIPLRVAELIIEIKHNLNAGDHLRMAKADVVSLMRQTQPYSYVTFRLSHALIPSLTDDQLVEYVANWVDVALVCWSAGASREIFPDDAIIITDDTRTVSIPGCGNRDRDIELDWIGTQDDLMKFLEATEDNAPSLKQTAQRLIDFPYWETDTYNPSVDILGSNVGEPYEWMELIPNEKRDGEGLYEILDYESIYEFRLFGFWGYIGFTDGKAKLLMMMPVSV